MRARDCARELGIPQSLVRELLSCGLLRGEKRQGQWVLEAGSADLLRNVIAQMRAHSQDSLPEDCWSWLYEEEPPIPEAEAVASSVSSPWSATTPSNAGAWLGDTARMQPPLSSPDPRRVFTRRNPNGQSLTLDSQAPSPPGPECPDCGKQTEARLLDADTGEDWYCHQCQRWTTEMIFPQ